MKTLRIYLPIAMSLITGLASAAPTQVEDVDQPARNPAVQATTTLTSTGMVTLPAIPGDRRFVIEYVSGACSAAGGVVPTTLRLTAFGQADHYFATQLYNNGATAVISQMTRLYIPPKGQVGLTIFPTTATALVNCNVTLSGHYVLLTP